MSDLTNLKGSTEQPENAEKTALSNGIENNVENFNYKKVVNGLLRNSDVMAYRDCLVKSVNVMEEENRCRVAFSLDKSIAMYDVDGVSRQIYLCWGSTFDLSTMLRETTEFGWLGSYIVNNPKVLPLLFVGAKITIVQIPFAAGEEVKNPLNRVSYSEDYVGETYDHDILISQVVGVEFSKKNLEYVDKIADKMIEG